MEDSVLQFVTRLIEKKAKLPPNADVEMFNYIDTGFVDSLGIMKFVVDIEAKFDIEITEDDMESTEFRTIGGLVSIIRRRIDAGTEK